MTLPFAVALALLATSASVYAQSSDPRLKEVPVTDTPIDTQDQKLQADGTEESGYRASVVSRAGLFDQTEVQDLPYSYSVAPLDLLTNVQAISGQEALGLMPTTQVTVGDASGVGLLYLSRGFAGNAAIDGLVQTISLNGPTPIEDKERIEYLSGVSGFLYGPSANGSMIGGVMNFVTKRPTARPMADVTVGMRGGSSLYAHGDFGGPLDSDGRFGYRLNLLAQDGDTAIENQSIERYLASAAFDLRISDTTVLQLDLSHQYYKNTGPVPNTNLNGDLMPPAPDLADFENPSFTYIKWVTDRAELSLRSQLNDAVTLRTGAAIQTNEWPQLFVNKGHVALDGSYDWSIIGFDDRFKDTWLYALFDFGFTTGKLRHTLTTGYNFQEDNLKEVPFDFVTNFGSVSGFNIFDPAASAAAAQEAALVAAGLNLGTGRPITIQDRQFQSVPITDRIDFNDRLALIVGGTWGSISLRGYDDFIGDTLGDKYLDYSKSAFTPSAAALFKARPDLTLYASYQESLQDGGIAAEIFDGLPVTNPGQVKPATHDQYELGAKWSLGRTLLTFAWFDVDRASRTYVLNADETAFTYAAAGKVNHKGIELGISGKLTDNLTMYGGGTAFDAKIVSEPDAPGIVGQPPSGVSESMAKLYAEYSFDGVPGLAVGAGVQYYGRQLFSNSESGPLVYHPSYVVQNLGARYSRSISGRETSFYLNIDNVSDERSWIGPLDPFIVKASASVKLY